LREEEREQEQEGLAAIEFATSFCGESLVGVDRKKIEEIEGRRNRRRKKRRRRKGMGR
jgi:hypothetical protein